MQFSRELINKYNYPVPRYTSYPPANYFKDNFSEQDYREAVRISNLWQPQNISFYIHVPFCNKMCFYCGCNSCPMPDKEQVTHYFEALKKEINIVVQSIDKSRKISQVHYGGGTPNSVPAEIIAEINNLLFNSFYSVANPEIAIECHPAYLDKAYIDKLIEAGFNRFSLGIQDFKQDVLKNVNREPSFLEISELINYIRQQGNAGINLDFIYGLPGQTAESFTQTIQKAIGLKPDRLVTFSYAHVPWVNKLQKVLEKKGLPDQASKITMYENAYNTLVESGYHPIGLDHYVLETDELYKALNTSTLHRNFQGYCSLQTTGQVYAFGVSAISQLQHLYVQNTKSTVDYISKINNGKLPVAKGYHLNKHEQVIKETITGFMCNKKLNWGQLSARLNMPEEEIKGILKFNPDKFQGFTEDGILTLSDEELSVSEEGTLIIRNVAAALDPMVNLKEGTFSKAV